MVYALDLDVRPGSGLGVFELGASLWNVLDLLRRLQHSFPQVDVKYDVESGAITPLVLYIRPHLELLFSGKNQRLHTIVLRKLRISAGEPPVTLRYKDVILSSPEDVLKRVFVSRTFGPTYPSGDDLRSDLRYPGLWFSFVEDGVADPLKAVEDPRMQEVKRVIISQKVREGEERDALGEPIECAMMKGDIIRAVAKVHEGVALYFYPSDTPPLHIKLGQTTAQDLTLDLGTPNRVHYQDDVRMTEIHGSTRVGENSESSYFYNYFQHGIDFMLSPAHVVTKIILHTNVPGSPLFQRYKRCNWEIEGKPEDDEDDTPPCKRFYERFETISHFLSPREPPPSMLLDRTDDEEALTLPNATSHLYGYDGVVLEVSESSQVLAVMLF
uniref:Uncharacterized protein n=1 Tax=Mycena chlorophos TaxID=658473 RepID=A0ABQ0M9A5_MYCCL|nr:predicted protein [Mycena chlorophos]GAT59909.1 predicted protein [Mycena chlorophos]